MLKVPNPPGRARPQSARLAVSVVIPLYNEQAILEQNLAALAPAFDRICGPNKWSFLLVENGSTDHTPELADALAQRWPVAQVIHLKEPNYGIALRSGLRAATTRWVFVLDIEQWDLPFIAWAWRNRHDYDVLIASKRADPTICYQSFYRRILSSGLNGLLQVFVNYTGTDTHGPKLVDRQSLSDIIAACELDRGQFDTELVLRAMRSRKRLVEVPFEYREMRPNRNWMVKKIVWNVFALRRLIKVMKGVPFEGGVRYYRFAREDVLAQVAELAEGEPLGETRV
jgi:glycosyltransferase involved in cell wall biosynthesis